LAKLGLDVVAHIHDFFSLLISTQDDNAISSAMPQGCCGNFYRHAILTALSSYYYEVSPMHEPLHGEYSLSLQGQLVICDYSEGFNRTGVIALRDNILELVKPLKKWVLFQRPQPSAGVTQDAIGDMYQAYVRLQHAGCLAVGIVDNSIFVHAGNFPKNGELQIPIQINKDEAQLLAFLSTTLKMASWQR